MGLIFPANIRGDPPRVAMDVQKHWYSQDDSASILDSRKEDATFQFWWSYVDMAMILLGFAHVQRDGIWELHLDSLPKCFHTFTMIT